MHSLYHRVLLLLKRRRLDDIVVFEPLTSDQLLGIARLLAEELDARLAHRNISLNVEVSTFPMFVAFSLISLARILSTVT